MPRLLDISRAANPLSFYNSLKATITFTLGTFIPLLILSLILAVFISNLSSNRAKKFLQISYYAPAVLSSVVAASI